MKIVLTKQDLNPQEALGDLFEEDGSVLYWKFETRLQPVMALAKEVVYLCPEKGEVPVSGVEYDEDTLAVAVKVTMEDRQAGVVALYNGWEYRPTMMDPLDNEAMLQYVLERGVRYRMQTNRDRMKWGTEKVWQHLATDRVRPSRAVTQPREGSWDCDKSPTKKCWYDNREDTMWDQCLFCGEPDERK